MRSNTPLNYKKPHFFTIRARIRTEVIENISRKDIGTTPNTSSKLDSYKMQTYFQISLNLKSLKILNFLYSPKKYSQFSNFIHSYFNKNSFISNLFDYIK